MTSWKTSPLNNLTDARYFNALNHGVLTFSFDVLHPQALDIAKAKAVLEWLHEPNVVAAFGTHQDAAEISFVLGATGIRQLELSFDHELCLDEELAPNLFIRITAGQIEDAEQHPVMPKAWVLEVGEGASGAAWTARLNRLATNSAIYLCLPADASTVKSWLREFPAAGIELQVIPEERPGWSSVDVYDEIIEAVEG
jgi:hypothetical protein